MPTTSSGPSLTAPSSTLTLREKLLFSQAVHKLGAGDSRWKEVGGLLQDCPVIDRPEGYWSEMACAGVYEALMQETGFDKQLKPEQQGLPHAEAHLLLAQHFYELRMKELRAEIEAKEQKFRTIAAEINAIKSGEAIYSPGMMLRLRDILVSIRASKKGGMVMKRSGVSDVMDVDMDGRGVVEKERGEGGESEVDVEMKVGEVGEGGKRTGGMAVFKAKDGGAVWRMTLEDLRLAAQGSLPLAQRRTPKVVEVTKEDAPIQAQAPPSTKRPSPDLVDIDMDLASGLSSQPVSAGPSKRITPVPTLIASTKSTPCPRQPSSEIREDAPLQPQGPPVRLAKPPLPSPVPSIKETPPVVKPTAPARPVPRRRRGAKPAVSPDEGVSDVVPESQERAESEASPVVQVEPLKPVPASRKRRPPAREEGSQMLVDEKDVELVPKSEKVIEDNEAVDEEIVPSSTAGDENRLVVEDEPSRGNRPVVDQSSEDDLTPPPMSPNLPPARIEASPRPTTPVKRVHEKQDTQEEQVDKPEPSKRRKIQRSATPVTPVREKFTQPSADELSPVPSTPAHKARGSNTKDSDAEDESESEAEVVVQPKKRGRPRVRVTEEPPKKKAEKVEKAEKGDEGDVEAGSRRTRRQEAAKRSSTRNVKQDMSSPPPSDKRNTRASPERPARTRGNRTRALKDKGEGEEDETDANGEEKAEEPTTVRRSGRRTRAMADLREEEDEDENEDEAMESAAGDVASPAATVDSDKRGKVPNRRNRDKEKGLNRGKESPPPKETKTRDAARSRGKESPSPVRDTQRREGRRRAGDTEEAEAVETSSEKGNADKRETETQPPLEVIDGDDVAQDEGESPRDESSKPETPTVRKTRSATTTTTTDTTTRQFKNQMNQLLDEISALQHGNHFKAPVKSSVAPGYYDIIRKPMDLKKIKANIKSGAIRSIDDFERDLWLIFCNAMMFNKPGTDYYIMAEEMMHWCEAKITEFKNAEANATSRS